MCEKVCRIDSFYDRKVIIGGFLLKKDKYPITFSIEVEPSVATVPPLLVLLFAPQPVKKQATKLTTAKILMIFFIKITLLKNFLFFLTTVSV